MINVPISKNTLSSWQQNIFKSGNFTTLKLSRSFRYSMRMMLWGGSHLYSAMFMSGGRVCSNVAIVTNLGPSSCPCGNPPLFICIIEDRIVSDWMTDLWHDLPDISSVNFKLQMTRTDCLSKNIWDFVRKKLGVLKENVIIVCMKSCGKCCRC